MSQLPRSQEAERRSQAPTCQAPGCHSSTREAKPFCPKHVKEHPYVQKVLSSLEQIETEVARVRRVGARGVNTSGLLATEILRELRIHGPRTVTRLARDLAIQIVVLKSYLNALAKQGRVRKTIGKRGRVFVHDVEGDRVLAVA